MLVFYRLSKWKMTCSVNLLLQGDLQGFRQIMLCNKIRYKGLLMDCKIGDFGLEGMNNNHDNSLVEKYITYMYIFVDKLICMCVYFILIKGKHPIHTAWAFECIHRTINLQDHIIMTSLKCDVDKNCFFKFHSNFFLAGGLLL